VAVQFISTDWVIERTSDPKVRIVDPRRPMRYLQGHLPAAINVPVTKGFDSDGRLRAERHLAEWLGVSGVGTDVTLVIYDSYDGQFGAMFAWIVDYLGHPDVRFLEAPFEHWAANGGPVFYRPVPVEPVKFASKPVADRRAVWRDLQAEPVPQIIDTRTETEFSDEHGHIPGARHIPWTTFVQDEATLFQPEADVANTLSKSGIDPTQPVITYCRSGMRAAVATIALARLGYTVRLYDGSFNDWTSRGLPVTVVGGNQRESEVTTAIER
jgi:thiosulfate/3-mercaptopyruvate sulfurtransferase